MVNTGNPSGDENPFNRLEDQANDAAKFADIITGRAEALTVEGAVQDLEPGDLLPPAIRNSVIMKTANTGVSLGAAWVALIAAITAGGSFSGFVGPALQSATSKATLGAYLTFGTAFFATFAMCTAIAISVFAIRAGVRNLGAIAAIFALTTVAACYLSLQLGLDDPDPAQFFSVPSGSPLAVISGYLKVYQLFYGPVPFLTGIGVGGIAGYFSYEISKK
jgi:hypothetical protein